MTKVKKEIRRQTEIRIKKQVKNRENRVAPLESKEPEQKTPLIIGMDNNEDDEAVIVDDGLDPNMTLVLQELGKDHPNFGNEKSQACSIF